MATTSRASFNHSCLKTPLNPVSRMPSPGYERRPGDVLRPLSSSLRATPSPARASGRSSRVNSAKASRASSASGPRSRISSATVNRPASGGGAEKQCGELLGPLLSFYESIPDYSELGHLSDREFYAKVHELRQTQRAYVSSLAAIEHQRKPGAHQERWTTGLQGVRCVLNDSRGTTPVPFLSPTSSARAGSPSWAKLAWGKVARARDEVLSSGPSSPLSSPRRVPRPSSSPLSSPQRIARPLGPVLRRARPPGPVPGKTRRPRPASGQRASPERGRSVLVNLPVTRVGSARRSRGGGGGSVWDCSLVDDEWPGGAGSVSDGDLRATPLPCALSEDSEDELLRMAAARGTAGGQRHVQSRGKNVAWREPQFTVPHPFEMTRREEDARYYSHLRHELLGEDEAPQRVSRSPSPQRRCHDVPLTSRLPLFHGILLQQELRRERQKRHSKARLLSQVRPFSFDNADLSPPPPRRRLLRKLWQSSPELRELSRVRGGAGAGDREFRATPMPHHLFSAETFLKRQEDDFLRMLRRRVRAEELLRDASLPPSMASRTLVPHSPCRPSTATLEHASSPLPHRRQNSAPLSKSSGSRRSRGLSPYDESPPRSRADLSGCSPYEARASYEAAAWGKVGSSRRPLSASASGSVSPIRHNLAAVLRIESCSRRRAEREAALQFEHRRHLEEARVRARVLRRRPAWRNMAHVSARRDLALRAVTRREEERSRQQDHARQMGSMMGRVLDIPTLFERQSQEGLRFRVQERRDMRARLDVSVSPRKSTACSPEALRTSKFVAPLETHISFYPGTHNGDEISGEEKRDEPEFPASDKHEVGGEKTPRGANKSIKSPLSRQGSKDSQLAGEGLRRTALTRVQSRQDSVDSQKESRVSRQASKDKESAEECEEEFESEREDSTPCTERAA